MKKIRTDQLRPLLGVVLGVLLTLVFVLLLHDINKPEPPPTPIVYVTMNEQPEPAPVINITVNGSVVTVQNGEDNGSTTTSNQGVSDRSHRRVQRLCRVPQHPRKASHQRAVRRSLTKTEKDEDSRQLGREPARRLHRRLQSGV